MTQVARLRVVRPEDGNPLHGVGARDEYDPTHFYVDASNRHDHSYPTNVRLHPDVVAEANRLLATGALAHTPLNTLAAFIRDAVYHQVQRITKLVDDPVFKSYAEDMRRMSTAAAIARDMDTKASMVADAREFFTKTIAMGDRDVVEGLVETYEPMVERTRQPYGDQLEQVLKNAREWLAR